MATTRVFLLRHGETQWNLEGRYQGHLDSPLTAVGLTQARAVAERLAQQPFAALYSSDLGRARQTAEIIAAQTGHVVIPHAGLRERHLGVFEGLTRTALKTRLPEEYRRFKSGDLDYAMPGGESARQLLARVVATLGEIARCNADQTVAAVSHGGVLSVMLRQTLGIPQDAPRRFLRFNASWNVFLCEEGKWFLETWGDTSHLDRSNRADDV